MTLSNEKHCEMLSDTIRDKSAAMNDGFKLFIQMFSSVVGGSVLLRVQYGEKIPHAFINLSNVIAVMVVITTGIIILDQYRSWYGYRRTLSVVAGKDHRAKPLIPKPS